ncbi:MAG: hypothetical protein QOI56_824 [Actinomycetota bacterium]|nr:hypothetical protein [Actinomycetota bacterium]
MVLLAIAVRAVIDNSDSNQDAAVARSGATANRTSTTTGASATTTSPPGTAETGTTVAVATTRVTVVTTAPPTTDAETPNPPAPTTAAPTTQLPPGVVSQVVRAGRVCEGGGQLCTPRSAHQVVTSRVLGFRYKADPDSCSSIKIHVYLDGVPQGVSPVVAPEQTVGFDFDSVPAGTYLLELQAEGVPGGCNTGTLGSWAGQLTITTSV